MKQKDYFQPMGQRDKVPLWTEEHTEQVKYGVVQGIGYSIAFFIIAMMTFNDYPHIEQSLKANGCGVMRPCSLDCESCVQDYHQHYLKAWRKVK